VNCRTPGKVCEGLWYLGRPESGVYWLEGRNGSIIISGGMSYLVPDLLSQFDEFGLKEDRLQGIVILHAHFDHIGIVPFFHRRNPGLKVYASARAWEILSESKHIDTINQFSARLTERMQIHVPYAADQLNWPLGLSGNIVSEGDVIDLENRQIQIFETPGHSSCSISGYVSQIKALFPSDGGGIPYKDTILAAANSNFALYLESLKKLETLETDYLCADHFGYVCGNEAKSYITSSIDSAIKERTRLEEIYRRSSDIDAAAREAASSFIKENPDYFLTFDIYEGVCRQMMRHIAKTMGR
jgi:glyoxylase-like metal-dependent hydrolase (beta-lactamase superfamily II)